MKLSPGTKATMVAVVLSLPIVIALVLLPYRPKPNYKIVKTTKIELPLSEKRIAGVPLPVPDPRKAHDWAVDWEHLAMVLQWRAEHCQTNIC